MFAKNAPSYTGSKSIKLDHPTSDTRELLNVASKLFELIYKPGFDYVKTSITLINIIPETEKQSDMFTDTAKEDKNTSLMSTIDELNDKYGEDTISLGSESLNKSWRPKSQWRSPNYTGDWNELAIVKC